MDPNEFRKRGYEMVDYIVDYMESISQRSVSSPKPTGYLIDALPPVAPRGSESFQKIMEDIEEYVVPGLTHCQHPGFHAYFPSSSCYVSLLAALLSDMLSFGSLNWRYTPCGCELETIMTNWYGKMIGLPDCFLHFGDHNRGSGVMQTSTDECIFLCMITARKRMLSKLQHTNPSISKAALLSSLVAYCSKHSDLTIKNVALTTLINVRVLDTDEDNRLRGKTLARAIEADRRIGLIPFFVNITVGTFSNGSCDPVKEIGLVCQKYDVWLNVDAAYGGNAMVCPEFRNLLEGVEHASSFIVNPSCWMLIYIDTSLMFVKDRYKVNDSVVVDRTRLGYNFDERDWSYPSKTEYCALKYFFVLRTYGVEGLQRHVRNHVRLAEMFEVRVKADGRFDFLSRHFGIVCFRLRASEEANKLLNSAINSSGRLFMTPAHVRGKYVLRFVVCTESANEGDIDHAWKVIGEEAEKVLKECPGEISALLQ